eukprot:TRINITY_DN5172_c0_g1_i2.p1 TRINITY_DN5172_c0_g1~~TRINITY_DN5172_c0_g1_i2.p1  ORF type:complete len:198 (+),score=-0.78 TRINITY_DN5172_c0_g1_i2:64-657(+)
MCIRDRMSKDQLRLIRTKDRFLPAEFTSQLSFQSRLSFLRSTCLLSDSRPYLALEDGYLPFELRYQTTLLWLGFPSNKSCRYGANTLQGSIFKINSLHFLLLVRQLMGQFGLPKKADQTLELLPLHSPLLRQSLLISFPPLTDMLKFSGSSCLIQVFVKVFQSCINKRSHVLCVDTCLLYTSPSPRDATLSRMPSSA